jgi:hypothetical protein
MCGACSTQRGATRNISKEVRSILEYFRCAIGNIAEAWSCCSSGSKSDMLRVWFICPFMPSEHGVNMTDSLEVCTEENQNTIVRFFWCLKE